MTRYTIPWLIVGLLTLSLARAAGTVSSCGTNITTSGYWNLSGNLTGSGGVCINISADDVVMDCQGHTIDNTGAGLQGIRTWKNDNVTITNCHVKDYNFAYELQGRNQVLEYSTATNTSPTGAWGLALNLRNVSGSIVRHSGFDSWIGHWENVAGEHWNDSYIHNVTSGGLYALDTSFSSCGNVTIENVTLLGTAYMTSCMTDYVLRDFTIDLCTGAETWCGTYAVQSTYGNISDGHIEANGQPAFDLSSGRAENISINNATYAFQVNPPRLITGRMTWTNMSAGGITSSSCLGDMELSGLNVTYTGAGAFWTRLCDDHDLNNSFISGPVEPPHGIPGALGTQYAIQGNIDGLEASNVTFYGWDVALYGNDGENIYYDDITAAGELSYLAYLTNCDNCTFSNLRGDSIGGVVMLTLLESIPGDPFPTTVPGYLTNVLVANMSLNYTQELTTGYGVYVDYDVVSTYSSFNVYNMSTEQILYPLGLGDIANATIDCAGGTFTHNYDASSAPRAIYLLGEGLLSTVQNCGIHDFYNGIYSDGQNKYWTFENISLTELNLSAIFLVNGDTDLTFNSISANGTLSGAAHFIQVGARANYGHTFNRLSLDSTTEGGLYLVGLARAGTYNNVIANSTFSTASFCIDAGSDKNDGITVSNVTCTGENQTGTGIDTSDGDNWVLEDLYVNGWATGLTMSSTSTGNTITDGYFCENTLDAADADGNTWTGNQCNTTSGNANCTAVPYACPMPPTLAAKEISPYLYISRWWSFLNPFRSTFMCENCTGDGSTLVLRR